MTRTGLRKHILKKNFATILSIILRGVPGRSSLSERTSLLEHKFMFIIMFRGFLAIPARLSIDTYGFLLVSPETTDRLSQTYGTIRETPRFISRTDSSTSRIRSSGMSTELSGDHSCVAGSCDFVSQDFCGAK